MYGYCSADKINLLGKISNPTKRSPLKPANPLTSLDQLIYGKNRRNCIVFTSIIQSDNDILKRMRVIEPHMLHRQKKLPRYRRKLITAFSVMASVAIIALVFVQFNSSDQSSGPVTVDDKAATSNSVAGVQSNTGEPQFFTGDQFQELYDSLALPNTEMLETPPVITGNNAADKRIRQIAESRGYVLRSVPVFPIVKTNAPGLGDDDLLQPKAVVAWKELYNSAQKDGIPLKLNSGYRSIEMQRELFLARLQVSPASIATGQADATVVRVLSQAAPPGYSRHHTGYTIDLVCGAGTESFENTSCFRWLKADNYKKAKDAGWMPSYPEGASKQGPEPEPWEYVWVGRDTVRR